MARGSGPGPLASDPETQPRSQPRSFLDANRRGAGTDGVESGAVVFVHRFGGSLNLNVHFHLLALDGVFERGDGELTFHSAGAPTRSDLDALLGRIVERVVRWLRRKGLIPDDGDDGGSEEPSALRPSG